MRSTDGGGTREGCGRAGAPAATGVPGSEHAHGPDLVEGLTELTDAWLEVDPDRHTVAETTQMLVGLERQIGRLKAAALALTSSIERREGYRATGHRNVQHLLQDVLKQSAGTAKAQADTARMLDGDLVETSRAVRDGEISPEHATAIVRAASKLDDDPHAEATLLAAARSGDPNQVRRTGDRLSQRADAEAARRQARRSFEQRTASFRTGRDGSVFFEGRLHQLGGEKLLTAIDALCAPASEDDRRSPGQRRADALVTLAELSMRDRRLPEDGGERPQLTVLVPLETIERRAGVASGTLSWTGSTPPPALEELVCEAGLSWLITDPAGLPLHLGRTRRFANRAQRRALRVRDGGCRWPGCSARPEWCIPHHVDFWDEGGPSDLDNLALVCPAHHATIHHGGWTLRLATDATITIRSPDGGVERRESAATARARHLHGVGLDEPRPSDDGRHRVAREVRGGYRVGRNGRDGRDGQVGWNGPFGRDGPLGRDGRAPPRASPRPGVTTWSGPARPEVTRWSGPVPSAGAGGRRRRRPRSPSPAR